MENNRGEHRPITQRFPVRTNHQYTAHTSALTPNESNATKRLYLGDLPYHCTPQEILEVFSQVGYAINCTMFEGFGFAYFQTTMLATKARTELQGKLKLHGRTMRINFAGRYILDQTPINMLTIPINSVYVHFHTTLHVQVNEAFLSTFF